MHGGHQNLVFDVAAQVQIGQAFFECFEDGVHPPYLGIAIHGHVASTHSQVGKHFLITQRNRLDGIAACFCEQLVHRVIGITDRAQSGLDRFIPLHWTVEQSGLAAAHLDDVSFGNVAAAGHEHRSASALEDRSPR